MQQDNYVRVESSAQVAECLDILMQAGGASLRLLEEAESTSSQPVVLKALEKGQWLLLDIGDIPYVSTAIKKGVKFQLMGQGAGKLVRSCELDASECMDSGTGLACYCPYPEYFEVLQRRDTFRAQLRLGMHCKAMLHTDSEPGASEGRLANLSMSGCLLELPLSAGSVLAAIEQSVKVELLFPNGTQFAIDAMLRHTRADHDQKCIHAGFEFHEPSQAQERALWLFVREIELESSRGSHQENPFVGPSFLFQSEAPHAGTQQRKRGEDYPTPMSRGLGAVSGFLDSQILSLSGGEDIDPVQLSRYAERLIALLDQDREGVLFALHCLRHDPPLVRHCVAVAVRLLDLVGSSGIPRNIRKSLAACALLHDLGKSMLPSQSLQAGPVSNDAGLSFQHVRLLMERLGQCQWLLPEITLQIIQQANERLDGSGYPEGLRAPDLHELARAMAVVDAVDSMSRDGLPINAVYAQLLAQAEAYDERWVKKYIRHFGVLPVGTLVRYRGGELAWILSLDKQGMPASVQLTNAQVVPQSGVLGDVVTGASLETLGNPVEIIVV